MAYDLLVFRCNYVVIFTVLMPQHVDRRRKCCQRPPSFVYNATGVMQRVARVSLLPTMRLRSQEDRVGMYCVQQ